MATYGSEGSGPRRARQPTSSASREAESAQETVRSAGREAGHAARREAREVANVARQRAQSLLDERRGAVAEEITGTAQAVRRAAEELTGQNKEAMARYAGRAADGLDQLSRTVRERDVGSLLDDLEGFARRQPGLVFGGAVAAGFLLARFLKSTGGADDEIPAGEAGRGASGSPTGQRGAPRHGDEAAAEPSGNAGGVLGEPTLDPTPPRSGA